MRPWVGEHITIAQFRTLRDCRLVDCSLNTTQSWFQKFERTDLNLVIAEAEEPGEEAKEPDASTKEEGVWGDIGFAFSKPVTRDEPHLDYIPTQILAENFRSEGYDGLIYKSLLDAKGKNIALFDPNAATFKSSCLYRTRSAAFEFVRVDVHDGYRARASCSESISSEFKE
jgi:hypothetical protein